METFRFKTHFGKSITPCPHELVGIDGSVIRVGSLDCERCRYYLKGSYLARLVKCSFPTGDTFNDGVNASIRTVERIFASPYSADLKKIILETLKELKKELKK